MAVKLSPFGPKPQFALATGLPAVGGQLFFYVAGSSTKQNTYTDSTGGSANTNPVVLNSLGEPTTQIWFTAGQTYKVVLAPVGDTDPPGSPVWTVDNISGINDTSTAIDEWSESGITPTFVSGTSFAMVGDQTSAFSVGRRIRFTVTAGTVYGTILTSAFAALTTITMTMDGATVLDSGLSATSLGILRPSNVSIPNFISAGSGITISYTNGKPSIAVSGQATVNGLVNGGAEVWQSGTSISIAASSNGYGADQWALTTGANQACTIAQATGLSSGSQFSATVQRNNGQTGTGVLVYEQPFELNEIVRWRGQTISISMMLSTGANWSPTSGTLSVAIACGTGANARRGNAPYTGETQPLATSFNIAAGTAAASYSATASAVIPTNTTQMTLMYFWTPTGTAGAADQFSIDDAMFSASAGAAYERRDSASESLRCQRYFLKSYDATVAPGASTTAGAAQGSADSGSNVYITYRYPVQMRTTPTVTNYSTTGASGKIRNTSTAADVSPALLTTGQTGMSISAALGGAGQQAAGHFTADARL